MSRVGRPHGRFRAGRQQRIRTATDRVTAGLAGLLVVVAGVMALPARSQEQIAGTVCRLGTLGLTDCRARLYDPPPAEVGALPLCEVDDVIEEVAPTVERQTVTFAGGTTMERWVGRDGAIRVVPGAPSAPGDVPSIADESAWPEVTPMPGVVLPEGGQWVFPGGEGEQDFVAALQRLHARGAQKSSALALFIGEDVAAQEATYPDRRMARVPVDLASAPSRPVGIASSRT